MELRQKSHQQLLDTVAALTDDHLQKPYAPYGEPLGPTMLDTLRGNSSDHYDTHRGWLEAFDTPGKSPAQ